ncbi:MAG: hypothetical protein WDA03_11590 [Trueperaceae bacterium]
MLQPHLSRAPRPFVTTLLTVLTLLATTLVPTAAAQGATGERATLADRWLRAQFTPYFGKVPLLSGEVAEVTYTSGEEGSEAEIHTWRFNQAGWPESTESDLNPASGAFLYNSTWSYGSDGLLNRIEIGGRSSYVWFFSWGANSLEVNGDPFYWQYTYDPTQDVLTQLETVNEVEFRRVYEFNADGSYSFTAYALDDEGEWVAASTAVVDSQNLLVGTYSDAFNNETTIVERDEAGNPVAGERVTSGGREAVTPLFWEVKYR